MPGWDSLPAALPAGPADHLGPIVIPLPDLARFDALLRGVGS